MGFFMSTPFMAAFWPGFLATVAGIGVTRLFFEHVIPLF